MSTLISKYILTAYLKMGVMVILMVMMVVCSVSAAPYLEQEERVDYHGWKVLQVKMSEDSDDGWLEVESEKFSENEIEVDTHRRRGQADVAISPSVLDAFTALLEDRGAEFTELVADLGIMLEEYKPSLRTNIKLDGEVTFERFMEYDEIISHLQELAALHPTLVELQEVGRSVEDRPIYLLAITSKEPSTLGPEKPIIFVDGGVHAREWVSPAAALHIITHLLTSPDLTRDLEWRVMPLVNPDGYITSWTTNRLWRKNRADTKVRCRGVDLNRNFGYKWGVSGTSKYPCSPVYHGPKAFSEPETRAVRDAIMTHANRTEAYVSFHAYGQMILHPWSYSTKVHRYNEDTLARIGNGMADVIREKEGAYYTVGTVSRLLYSAAGGSDDWVAGEAGVPLTYTIELRDLGKTGFVLAPHLIQPTVNDAWLAVNYLAGEVIREKRQELAIEEPFFPVTETTMDPTTDQPLTTTTILPETTTKEEPVTQSVWASENIPDQSLLTTTLFDMITERETVFPDVWTTEKSTDSSSFKTTSNQMYPSTTFPEVTTEREPNFPSEWTTDGTSIVPVTETTTNQSLYVTKVPDKTQENETLFPKARLIEYNPVFPKSETTEDLSLLTTTQPETFTEPEMMTDEDSALPITGTTEYESYTEKKLLVTESFYEDTTIFSTGREATTEWVEVTTIPNVSIPDKETTIASVIPLPAKDNAITEETILPLPVTSTTVVGELTPVKTTILHTDNEETTKSALNTVEEMITVQPTITSVSEEVTNVAETTAEGKEVNMQQNTSSKETTTSETLLTTKPQKSNEETKQSNPTDHLNQEYQATEESQRDEENPKPQQNTKTPSVIFPGELEPQRDEGHSKQQQNTMTPSVIFPGELESQRDEEKPKPQQNTMTLSVIFPGELEPAVKPNHYPENNYNQQDNYNHESTREYNYPYNYGNTNHHNQPNYDNNNNGYHPHHNNNNNNPYYNPYRYGYDLHYYHTARQGYNPYNYGNHHNTHYGYPLNNHNHHSYHHNCNNHNSRYYWHH